MTVTNANMQKIKKPMQQPIEEDPILDILEEKEEEDLTVSEKYWRDKLKGKKKHGSK